MIASCASSLDHSSACAVEAELADELGIAVPAETIEWRPFPSPRRIRYTNKHCIGVIGLFKGQLSQFAPYQADLVATGTPEQKDLFLPRGVSLAFFKRAGLSLGGFRRSGGNCSTCSSGPTPIAPAVIGRLYARADARWLAELLIDLEDDVGEIARLVLVDGLGARLSPAHGDARKDRYSSHDLSTLLIRIRESRIGGRVPKRDVGRSPVSRLVAFAQPPFIGLSCQASAIECGNSGAAETCCGARTHQARPGETSAIVRPALPIGRVPLSLGPQGGPTPRCRRGVRS
jgi:hypothetical protein